MPDAAGSLDNAVHPWKPPSARRRRVRAVGRTNARERVAAEQRAGTDAAARGEGEVMLAGIYRELGQAWAARGPAHALDLGQAAREEMELELRCVRADPQVAAAFQALVAAGRRVVLVSDLYLPAECVEAMLARCGIAGFERLFLSSETAVAKADGSVWPFLRAATGLAPGARHGPRSSRRRARPSGALPTRRRRATFDAPGAA